MGSFVTLLALVVAPAHAADLDVGLGQTYATIADAYDDAGDGDVIRVHAPHTESDHLDWQSGSLTVEGVGDSTVIVLTSDHDDGFFRARNGASITIKNVTISGAGSKRALRMESSGTMRLDGVTVRDGQHANGPSLEAKNGAVVVIVDSTFINGSGDKSGHILADSGTYLTVSDSTFSTGDADEHGGAVLCQNGSTCLISNTTFLDNHADGNGGALYFTGTTEASVEDSHFEGNTASVEGAGVYFVNVQQGRLVRSTFCENQAQDDGGGALSRDSQGVEVHNNLFFQNRSGDQGGGLRSRQGNAIWSHNLYWENLSYGDGHGMESESSTVFTDHDIVVGNEQLSDGDGRFAVWANNSTFTMKWSVLWSNPDGDFNAALDPTNLQQPPAFQGTTRACGFEFFKPAWQGNLFDAGSTASDALDLDGSTADIGLFGGPEAPADYWVDADEDGVPVLWDCDDDDDARAPDQDEICDGVDNDCDGDVDEDISELPLWYVDDDGDGFGVDDESQAVASCTSPGDGYSQTPGDCDDDDELVNPLAVEQCDGVDNDCTGGVDNGVTDVTWYADGDGDGYGRDDDTLEDCAQPDGYAADGGDCDDGDADVSPGATEVVGNDVDEDCDGEAQQEEDTGIDDTGIDDTGTDDTGTDDTGLPAQSDRAYPGDVDTGAVGPGSETGCGCATGGGAGTGWALALLGLMVRRRRR